MDIFSQIGLGIIAAAVLATLGSFVRQPAILGYILAGVFLGPTVFGVIQDPELVNTVSHIGIMLLLFLIGLEMGVDKLRDMGLVSIAAGVGQVLFTGVIGLGIALSLGFPFIQSMYIAVALTFSSTVIAIKIMSEKQELGSLHGQISIGILIIQDLLAIVALLILGGFGAGSFHFDPSVFGLLFLKGAGLALAAALLSKFVMSSLFRRIAGSNELLILCAIAWCFLVAIVGKKIGFSMEIGAFIAGVSLANIPYAAEISSKTRIIRDFFVTIFFVALGASLIFQDISSLFIPFLVFSLFVLIGNPLIIMLIMRVLKYDVRTGLLTGLNMANISEFSLIVIALGASLGHIDQTITALIAFICVGTMTISSYMITFGEQMYRFLKPYLTPFEVQQQRAHNFQSKAGHIVIFGYGDSGREIALNLLRRGVQVVVVDHNNAVFKLMQKEGVPCVFGSVEDEETLNLLALEGARMVISTLPHPDDMHFVLAYLRRLQKKPPVFVTAQSGKAGLGFFNSGADYVVVKPHVGAKLLLEAAKDLLPPENLGHPKNVSLAGDRDIDYARFVEQISGLRLKELQ
ncbi:sodium:proton exchanger [Candidatus Gracilibacteria bacterium CG17_big_fil_post_rev_8_21_14_2_50_48_13]|nr:MAG: sodium:proton exchanger [Candidatus Gracilibacteria bacterium CG17_big_fil_post_rev_8_21_14_2_50_48_13]